MRSVKEDKRNPIIKEPRSLEMKCYLINGRLSSLVKSWSVEGLEVRG